jgi:hypothetical protein
MTRESVSQIGQEYEMLFEPIHVITGILSFAKKDQAFEK